jgi:hypothetical protein
MKSGSAESWEVGVRGPRPWPLPSPHLLNSPLLTTAVGGGRASTAQGGVLLKLLAYNYYYYYYSIREAFLLELLCWD